LWQSILLVEETGVSFFFFIGLGYIISHLDELEMKK
jgi:hypothetical protein